MPTSSLDTAGSAASARWSRRRALIGCAAAWLPALAAPATVATVPMQPVQVAPDCYAVFGQSALGSAANQNFISNAGFVVTCDSVVVIDALGAPALARELLQQIARITAKPVSHVLVTHYHADHVYGLQVLHQAGARIVAQRKALEYLNSETARLRLQASREQLAPWVEADTHLVGADRWLDGDADLLIDGVLFQLRAVGPAHTPEDMVVNLPARQVLYAGDLVFRSRIPFVGQADSRRWIAALESVQHFDARVMVAGHGPVSNDPAADISLTRDYLLFLRQAMGQAARNLDPFEEAYRKTDWSRFEKMALFDAANRMNAYNTYLLMESEHE